MRRKEVYEGASLREGVKHWMKKGTNVLYGRKKKYRGSERSRFVTLYIYQTVLIVLIEQMYCTGTATSYNMNMILIDLGRLLIDR